MPYIQIVINTRKDKLLITTELIKSCELLDFMSRSYQHTLCKTVDNHSFFYFLCVDPD
jgi:hypothetical protein